MFCNSNAALITLIIINVSFMNKADLVIAIQRLLGSETTTVQAKKALAAFLEGIKTGIKKKKRVQLIGFGTFKVANRKARTGINPKTQEKLKIKASKSVRFVCGKALKASL